ncbi:MAG: WD40 repeat domain-containing protein [Acidobacteriota bacterium]
MSTLKSASWFQMLRITIIIMTFIAPTNGSTQSVELIKKIKIPRGIASIAFSPDGQLLACGGENVLTLFDVKTGKLLKSSPYDMDRVINSISFSPDGRLLASADDDGRIIIHDVRTWKTKRTLIVHQPHETPDSHDFRVFSVSFSPDGKTLVSGSGGFECRDCLPYGEVNFWDLNTGRLLSTLPKQKDYIWSVSFSPNGKLIAIANGNAKVVVWDAKQKKVLDEFPGMIGEVYSVRFSKSGNKLVAASEDKTVMVWDVRTRKVEFTFADYRDRVLSATFLNEIKIAAVGGKNGLKIFNLNSTKSESIPIGKDLYLNCVSSSLNGKNLAIGTSNGTIMLWKIK